MNLIEITIVSVGKNPLEEMEYIIVKKRVQTAGTGCSVYKDTMFLVHFQGKAFSITVIQVYAPPTAAKEARVQWCYEDVHHSLELTFPKNVLFILGTGMEK